MGDHKSSKRMEMSKEGVLNVQYSNDHFVKVKPAFQIGKVLFSFVKKGERGKGFDVYMDVDQFDNWADDILSFRMERVISKEKGEGIKYPTYYKYVAGDKGTKSVGFAPSTSQKAFATLNGVITKDSKTEYVNIPVDYNWLRTLSKYFKVAFEEYGYRKSMVQTALKASEAFRNTNVEEEYNEDKSDAKNGIQEPSTGSNKTPAASPSTEAEKAPVEKPEELEVDSKEVEVKTLGKLTAYGKSGNKCIKAITKDNKEMILCFMNQNRPDYNIDNWNKFTGADTENRKLRIKYAVIKDKYVVTDILNVS